MPTCSSAGLRRALFVTPAVLLSGALLAGTRQPAAAQEAVAMPTIVVEGTKPKPNRRAQRAAVPHRTAVAPAPASEGPVLPADTTTISAAAATARSLSTSDSAALIADIPGGAAWGAGGVSSLPAINGVGADRVQVAINSMLISPACPNEMNPPLSFVNPTMIANMRAYLGVAPVSVGGDYIGAKIDVSTAPPLFAKGPGWLTTGSVSGFFRSNGNGYGVDATATVANNDTSVTYTGGWAKASDYKAGDGTRIKSTLYEIQNHALSISKRSFGNLVTVQVGGQFIPYQGYVNQYMDMVYNQSAFINARYEGVFDWGQFEATGFYHHVQHTMGFIAPDKTGSMPMDTKASDAGYTLKASFAVSGHDLIRVGNEFYHNKLDDWWDPVAGSSMMGPNTFTGINGGERSRFGSFVEWERHWDREWTTLLGLRNDMVWSDTGDVAGYNAMMYGADAAAFNARNHARTDANFDGSALVRYEPGATSQFELGFARKTRSPNLYERYAWSNSAMAMSMIGWFGDGNGYLGNLDLKPEKAHTASFTAAFHDPAQQRWEVRVTPYYSYVEDYIDVDRCALRAGSSTCTAANLTATNDFVDLQFANHDAYLYGVNLDGRLQVWENPVYGRGVLRGQLGYVRGQRSDGVNLYHVMPINGKLALDHTLGNWSNSVELQLVGAKDDVSQVHNELTTQAYALVNLRTGYQWDALRLDLGVDNLFNTNYYLPLGGADLVDYKVVSMMGSSAAYGYNVAGPGRSLNARLTVRF